MVCQVNVVSPFALIVVLIRISMVIIVDDENKLLPITSGMVS